VVEFRVLGPLEVVKDGVTVPLHRPRLRALLALLLLHANEVVSSDRIVDALWGDDPPQNAANAVQTTVSRLRKQLVNGDGAVAEMIRTRPPGYVIQLAPDDLDLARFERLVQQGRGALQAGRPEAASQLLRDALATWRGRALADVQYAGLLERECERLEEERLTTFELRIDADLACARHTDLVGELEALVAENPYRERLRGQLMLALYRSGRQAEALAAYQHGRRLLVDELGIEPSRALQELERSILRQDPKLEEVAAGDLEPPRSRRTSEPAPYPTPVPARRAGRRRWLLAGLALALLAVAAWAATIPFGGSDSPHALSRLAPNAVGVIDPETNRLVGQVRVDRRPTRLAVGEDAAWVLNADDRTISRVDVDGRRISRSGTIPLSQTGEPAGLAVGEGAVWLGTGLYGPLSLSRINPSFDEIAQTMQLGRAEEPFFAARWQVAIGHGSIWTAGPRFGTVLRIDPRTMRVVSRIDVGIEPATLSVGEGAVWAGGSRNVVKRISPRTNKVDREWEVQQGPLAIATSAGAVWVTAAGEDVVARIDTVTETMRTVQVGDFPTAVAAGQGSVWVANAGDGTVYRIDPETREVVATIQLGASPEAIAVANRVVLVATSAGLETQ
jgi:YVTN family beta-propeller protein